MEIETEDMVLSPRLRVVYGIILIVLGIVTMIVTYKYVIPIGSILLIGSGLILIFWKKWNSIVCDNILMINK